MGGGGGLAWFCQLHVANNLHHLEQQLAVSKAGLDVINLQVSFPQVAVAPSGECLEKKNRFKKSDHKRTEHEQGQVDQ
jgi:hypothetical protein